MYFFLITAYYNVVQITNKSKPFFPTTYKVSNYRSNIRAIIYDLLSVRTIFKEIKCHIGVGGGRNPRPRQVIADGCPDVDRWGPDGPPSRWGPPIHPVITGVIRCRICTGGPVGACTATTDTVIDDLCRWLTIGCRVRVVGDHKSPSSTGHCWWSANQRLTWIR